MGTTRATVTSVVDGLVGKGLVSRKTGVNDRRMYFIGLTESGKDLIRQFVKGITRIGDRLFHGIDASLIIKLRGNLVSNDIRCH